MSSCSVCSALFGHLPCTTIFDGCIISGCPVAVCSRPTPDFPQFFLSEGRSSFTASCRTFPLLRVSTTSATLRSNRHESVFHGPRDVCPSGSTRSTSVVSRGLWAWSFLVRNGKENGPWMRPKHAYNVWRLTHRRVWCLWRPSCPLHCDGFCHAVRRNVQSRELFVLVTPAND